MLYLTAKQDGLRCSPALWPVGPVVRQWTPDQPVRPQWVAGPHLRCLWPGLEPAGLQVSSTVCTALPFTASSSSNFTRVPPFKTGAARASFGHRRELWPPSPPPHLLPPQLTKMKGEKAYTHTELSEVFILLLISVSSLLTVHSRS